jgi:hypothetical protein
MNTVRCFIPFVLIALLLGCASSSDRGITESAFLRPYVDQLKKTTSPAHLNGIKTLSKSELILLHHGYGTGIRNQWLRGQRDPKLLRFFHDNGIDDPDAMSMVIIKALWYDLNSNLSPAERASIETKRALVARKRACYEKLESEGEVFLSGAQRDFERCYESYGLPSKNPENRTPFFKLVIERNGHVREIGFFEGATADLKQSLERIAKQFTFSAFTDDEQVTLYVLELPHCRIAERDTLYGIE